MIIYDREEEERSMPIHQMLISIVGVTILCYMSLWAMMRYIQAL